MNPLLRLLGAAASHGLLTGQLVFSTASSPGGCLPGALDDGERSAGPHARSAGGVSMSRPIPSRDSVAHFDPEMEHRAGVKGLRAQPFPRPETGSGAWSMSDRACRNGGRRNRRGNAIRKRSGHPLHSTEGCHRLWQETPERQSHCHRDHTKDRLESSPDWLCCKECADPGDLLRYQA